MTTPSYRPSLFIKLSIVLHIVMLGLALLPGTVNLWPYALLALIINHMALTALGLWPKSQLLGDNWLHLPPHASNHAAIAITIDDGPDPGITPKVLAILQQYQVQATFFCIAQRVELYPELARQIVAQGHAIENHSYRHAHTFSLWGPHKLHTEIKQAQDAIERTVGRRPQFFRAPAGLRNPFLDYALQKNKVLLATWTRRGFDTRTGDAKLVFKRLTTHLKGRDILLLHDRNCATTGQGEPVICAVLPRLIEHIHAQGLRCVRLDQAY